MITFLMNTDVLNKIAGVLKYAPEKIGAEGWGKTIDNNE